MNQDKHIRDAFGGHPSIRELKQEWPKGCAAPTGYVEWQDWAEAQTAHGLEQAQCEWCKRYFFPQEKPNHLRCKP